MKMRYTLLWALIALPTLFLNSQVIIWDIGEVLFRTNRFGVGRSVGLSHFIRYCLFDWKSPQIEPLLFEILDMINVPALPDNVRACTDKGVPLPAIMCHWQAGTITGPEIIARSMNHIELLDQEGYFVSYRERRLVEKTICTIFDPELLASHMVPINAGLQLLMECAHETNEDGTPKNYLIALTNWDPLSFNIFSQLHNTVFSHFDRIIVSGYTGLIKPRKAAFMHLIKNCNLTPQTCLVIDDQLVNLEAAQQCGFQTFHVHNGNYRQLRQTLVSLNALST